MTNEYEKLLSQFGSQRVLVVGDVMLDRYWIGDATRISPEAPVPVIRMQRTSCVPGGAGNVALNISALGAGATMVGLVGKDSAAEEVRTSFAERGVTADHLFVDSGRTTTVKTRIIAHKQQVVRVDDEQTNPLSPEQEKEALKLIESLLASCKCAVLSDYAKGFVTPSLSDGVIKLAQAAGVPLVVDPKAADPLRYRGATLIKPNRLELSLLTGMTIRSHQDTLAACKKLSQILPDTSILATEGADGMTLHMPGGDYLHFETRALDVFDVTGAGDTVIAVTSVAIASGADFSTAAFLANCAAGIVVGEFGCATVSAERLLASVCPKNTDSAA